MLFSVVMRLARAGATLTQEARVSVTRRGGGCANWSSHARGPFMSTFARALADTFGSSYTYPE